MWSDTITEENGILWYWFWHTRTWGRVKLVILFISVHTIASKVKMCVAGKIWNGIREKSNQRLRSFYSAANFRPDPPFHQELQIRQRGVILSSVQSDAVDMLCPSLCTEKSFIWDQTLHLLMLPFPIGFIICPQLMWLAELGEGEG